MLLFLIILFVQSCNNSNTASQTSKKTYKLYFARLTGITYPVSLWMNGSLAYKDVPKYGQGSSQPNFMLLSSFERQKTTMFKVKTMYKDTIFSYKTDSIEELYIWLPDESIKHYEIDDDKTISKHAKVE